MRRARQLLQAEIQAYDFWLIGDVWGFRLFDGKEESDSCWGFCGDVDDIKKEIAECLPPDCRDMVEDLELRWVSAEAWMGME